MKKYLEGFPNPLKYKMIRCGDKVLVDGEKQTVLEVGPSHIVTSESLKTEENLGMISFDRVDLIDYESMMDLTKLDHVFKKGDKVYIIGLYNDEKINKFVKYVPAKDEWSYNVPKHALVKIGRAGELKVSIDLLLPERPSKFPIIEHYGDLKIDLCDKRDFSELKRVFGSLTISDGVSVKIDQIEYIQGNLDIGKNVEAHLVTSMSLYGEIKAYRDFIKKTVQPTCCNIVYKD